ncbi:MAG: methylated-DNA--[protein]-cysteine S-methyltransferase [Anaerolineae bacterium]|nr:methylated-DNA--[protein]-cysteine S-methyltransferase [Anaerolineae bacterium]
MADELHASVCEVPGWGWVGLVASDRGLRLLVLPQPSPEAAIEAIHAQYPEVTVAANLSAVVETIATSPAIEILIEAMLKVRAYLAGERREFQVPLDLRGHTEFALSVWAAARRIGYGETRTYRWIGEQLGGGSGIYQAVGAALGANPVPLIIPCHRVVGADGSLHGYAGGLEMKRRLLALESGQGQLAGL